MKKKVTSVLMLAIMLTMLSTTTIAAEKAITYYDENGNPVTINGMYYNSQGYPMFNAGCYYIDADGNPIYVGGCRAYYYDENGNLLAGNYYYDANNKAVTQPSFYPGGFGCGAWYYDAQGNTISSVTYYDDFGNPVDPPAVSAPVYRRGGCCWGY